MIEIVWQEATDDRRRPHRGDTFSDQVPDAESMRATSDAPPDLAGALAKLIALEHDAAVINDRCDAASAELAAAICRARSSAPPHHDGDPVEVIIGATVVSLIGQPNGAPPKVLWDEYERLA